MVPREGFVRAVAFGKNSMALEASWALAARFLNSSALAWASAHGSVPEQWSKFCEMGGLKLGTVCGIVRMARGIKAECVPPCPLPCCRGGQRH
jgi:hypothetical protein